MNTNELAKELDRLARALRALTFDAKQSVEQALELGRRRGYQPANKFEPRALTVAAISEAIHKASRRPAVSVELRKDVYQRRIERNAQLFADRFAIEIRAGRPAPAGERFYPRYTRIPAGARSVYDAVPRGETALNADAYAWERAAHSCLVRLAPAYGYNEIDRLARTRHPSDYRPEYRLRESLLSAIQDWLASNTVLIADVDADGQVLRFTGVDPAPFIQIRDAVAAGNADPLGLFK